MRLSLPARVALQFAALAAVVAAFVAVALVEEAEAGAERQLHEALRAEVRILHRLLEDLPDDWTPEDAARRVAQGSRHGVFLLDARGRAVTWRAEDTTLRDAVLQSAIPREVAGLAGVAPVVRVYETPTGVEIVVAALAGPEPYRDLRLVVAAPSEAVVRARQDARRRALGGGLLLVLLAAGVGAWTGARLRRQTETLRRRLSAAAEGGPGEEKGAPTLTLPELTELAEAAERIEKEAGEGLSAARKALEGMQLLIDAIDEGVLELTADARLLRANRSARSILGLPGNVTQSPVGALVRHPEVRAYLEGAVRGGLPARELTLGERVVRLSARPLPSGGVVVTLLDVSELRRVEQMRRDFVANASHELKTPLTSIRGYAETLLDDEPPPEIARRFLTTIRDNAVRLQRLVEDLLDLSRLESGRWVAKRQPVHVGEVAREAWTLVRDAADARGVTLEVDADVRAGADREGLVQIFVNLFENAIRHVDEGGHVWVRASAAEDRVVVEVLDDGEGIPSRALPRIFERFYRADGARDRDAGGTGLGLSIVRHLVQAMGGSVSAESELGRGTTIRFTLPR